MNAGRMIVIAVCLALGAAPTPGGQPSVQALQDSPAKPPPPPPPDAVTVYKLAVHPAAAPVPALKYALLPTVLEQTPGNAMALYTTAMAILDRGGLHGAYEKVDKWLTETPLEELPLDEIASVLPGGAPLEHIALAARRESCEWDLPIREQGYSLLLPSLGAYRKVAKIPALRARLAIAEGRYDDALGDLKTGFGMARHIAAGRTLINDLVAVSISDIMLTRASELAQRPDGPNLYWALTALPRPTVDLNDSLEYEAQSPYLAFPALTHLRDGERTPAEYKRTMAEILALAAQEDTNELTSADLALKMYPQAKGYLREQGFSDERIEAMPVQQAVLIYMMENYDYLRDEMFKWFYVPYWEAHQGFREAEALLRREIEAGRGSPATALLPSLGRAYFLVTKLDRRIAALRCVEAIRLYAAAHEGKLPASLEAITEVPIPINPVTGKPFPYSAKANTAVLEAPAMPDQALSDSERYEITIQVPTTDKE